MLNKILFIVFITWYNASFAVFEKTNLVVNSLHDGIVNTIKDNGVLFSGDSFQLKIKPGDNTYLFSPTILWFGSSLNLSRFSL